MIARRQVKTVGNKIRLMEQAFIQAISNDSSLAVAGIGTHQAYW
jgi:hypothetical protein